MYNLNENSRYTNCSKNAFANSSTNQSFCDIENATISDLAITGNSVLWYATATGGTPLDGSEPLTTNTTYYASQTINSCESPTRLTVNVIINETVVVPQSSSIPILYECDTMADGDDTNGFTVFDLTTNETILLNGKSASNYTFNYFTDLAYSIPILHLQMLLETLLKMVKLYMLELSIILIILVLQILLLK